MADANEAVADCNIKADGGLVSTENRQEQSDRTANTEQSDKTANTEQSDRTANTEQSDRTANTEPVLNGQYAECTSGESAIRHRNVHSQGLTDQARTDPAAAETTGAHQHRTERYQPPHLVGQEDWEDNIFSDDEGHSNSGEESDVEDNENDDIPFPGAYVRRLSNPELPETVTTLQTEEGSKVYVVGTAHFSESSQEDVAKTIQATQPDVVMVELCHSRVNILQLDEETLLQEAQNINLEKIRTAIKQSGVVQGIMHLLLLSMSAHLTKQLGMAPGGEFRRAFQEAQKIHGCRIHLGDRPINITLRRALASLSWWQKLRLGWYLVTSKEPISKEEVEKCKQRDLLEEMLREMTGEFPALSEVFVTERDLFLANSLRVAARPIPHHYSQTGYMPAVVVGVVGIGHVPGIADNWARGKLDAEEVERILRVPEGSMFTVVLRWSMRAALVGLLSWSCYRAYKWAHVLLT